MLTSAGALLAASEGGGGGGQTAAVTPLVWAAFFALIAVLLLIDLKVVMREAHEVSTREAAIYSAVWIALGVAFTGVVWFWMGGSAAQEYITGYLIEKSLSVDNVFVWSVLFTFFAVPNKYQHGVLFWGIFGAVVFRLAFIFAGVALLESLSWIVYVFGAFLLYTAYKLFTSEGVEVDPEHNPVLVRIRQVLPQTEGYREDHFFVRENGRRMVTPLLTVLVSIEFTDILFAVDSIPAILAITKNQFIVFSSNAFAILGLRALYFLLAGIQDRFIYLDKGLGIILGFVGLKFIAEGIGGESFHIPTWTSLAVIAVVLALTFWLSWRHQPESMSGSSEDTETADATTESEHSD
ncbi:MAG: TerC family protein [Actinobacteria bacterium]|nr:TerC family protein [Actinomycetota bacterium]